MKKRVLSLMLAVVMALATAMPACAANPVKIYEFKDGTGQVIAELSDVTGTTEAEGTYDEPIKVYHLPANATVTFHIPGGSDWWSLFRCNGMWVEQYDSGLKNGVAYTCDALNAAIAAGETYMGGEPSEPTTEFLCEIMEIWEMTMGERLFKLVFDGAAAEKPAESVKPVETAKPAETAKPQEPEKDSKWEVKEIASPQYSSIFRTEDGTLQAVRDGKSVLLDGNGKEIGGDQATYSFREGLAAVNQNGKWGFADTNGKVVIPCQYSRVGGFYEGLSAVYQSDGTLGYIDKSGKTVISFARGEANDVYDFSEGLARITKNGKMGFINRAGAEVVPCEYDNARDFRGGLAQVAVNSNGTWKWGLVNAQGKVVAPCKYDSMDNLYDGFVKVCAAGKWGVVNADGQEVIPCVYGSVGANACKGVATVDINGTYSYISVTTGTVYSEAQECGENMTRVCQGEPYNGGKWGVVDATGKEIVPCKYDNVGDFAEGLVPVRDGYRWGVVDATGKEVVSCQYNEVSAFSEGLARVRMIDPPFYGFIDRAGNVVIPGTYENAMNYSEGLAAVYMGTYPDQKWGYIDRTGKEVIPGKYEAVKGNERSGFYSNGVAAVRVDGKWGLIDLGGNELAPCRYDDIDSFLNHFQEHFIDVRIDGKYGLMDDAGEEVVACVYESVKVLGDGFVAVKQDGKWGLLSITKKEEAPPAPQEPSTYTANPTNDPLKVDGVAQIPTAYKIGDSNYFQLRDVAMMLSGTKAQFSVDYDPDRQAVVIVTGEPYKPLGTELAGAAGDSTEAILGNNDIYINGEKADFAVYKINGANFFQIRALGQALGFNVGWTKADGMFIESDKPYDPNN